MYKAILDNSEYTFRNGAKVIGSDLKKRAGYELINLTPCVFSMDGDIVSSLVTVSSLCKNYNISEDGDYEDVVDRINEADNARRDLQREQEKLSTATLNAAKIIALTFTDEQALEVPDLYPIYEVDHAYKKDERFTYNGRLFKVNQDHTSAAQWVPYETGTESLYTCLEMAGDGYLVWTQPTGAHNAYNTGDIVHYPTAEDQLYQSQIDGNTTVPGSDERWWKVYTAE